MNKYVLTLISAALLTCSATEAAFNDSLKQQLAVFKADSERYVESLTRRAKLTEVSELARVHAAVLIEEINQLQNEQSVTVTGSSNAQAAFAELNEQTRNNKLPQKKNQLRQLSEALKRYTLQLGQIEGDIATLKAQLISDKDLVVNAVLENFQEREFKRAISFECGTFNKEQCQSSAREFVLRELSEELSGATVESQTLIKNFIIVEDNVKVNSSHTFEEIKILSSELHNQDEASILDLELVATVSQLTSPDELEKLEHALNERINDFISQLSQS